MRGTPAIAELRSIIGIMLQGPDGIVTNEFQESISPTNSKSATGISWEVLKVVTEEEFKELLHFVKQHSRISPPDVMISNYRDYHCRATVARLLAIYCKYYEPAIRLMKTVIEENPEEIDEKVWALRDLGVWIWLHSRDGEQALACFDEAMRLMENTEDWSLFFFADHGEIWYQRLNVLMLLGKEDEAVKEAEEKIQNMVTEHLALIPRDLCYGYLFLAERTAGKGDYLFAIEYLIKTLHYVDVDQIGLEEKIKTAYEKRLIDPMESYDQLYRITRHLISVN